MRRLALGVLAILAVASAGWLATAAPATTASYDVVATAIEGCSCPLFCPCYYNSEPAGGHHCQFNNAYRFAEGSHWGDVDLSGAKVWFSGDLGAEFGDGQTDWLVLTHDAASSAEQRDAITAWATTVFPVEWGSFEVREDDLTWEVDDESARASMASGMAALELQRVRDPHGEQAIVLNTPYWASDSNDGFELAYSTHHFDGEPESFSHEGRNGFIITLRNRGELPEQD